MAAAPIIMGIGTGLSALSGLLGQRSQSQQQQRALSEQRRQFNASQAQQDRQFAANMGQQQAQAGLGATQMDPLAQQRSRQRAALVEKLMSSTSSPTLEGNKFTGGIQWSPEMFSDIASFFTPEARGAAEAQFAQQARAASGGRYSANLPSFGYGASAPAVMPGGAMGNTYEPGTSPSGVQVPADDPEAFAQFWKDYGWSRPGSAMQAFTDAHAGSTDPGMIRAALEAARNRSRGR